MFANRYNTNTKCLYLTILSKIYESQAIICAISAFNFNSIYSQPCCPSLQYRFARTFWHAIFLLVSNNLACILLWVIDSSLMSGGKKKEEETINLNDWIDILIPFIGLFILFIGLGFYGKYWRRGDLNLITNGL